MPLLPKICYALDASDRNGVFLRPGLRVEHLDGRIGTVVLITGNTVQIKWDYNFTSSIAAETIMVIR